MASEPAFLNRAVAFGSAVVYWGGVWLHARRVRRWIGRAPNVRPRGRKEKLLWAGWTIAVWLWLTIPFLSGKKALGMWAAIYVPLVHPISTAAGIALLAAGYAGTLWCYSAMGRNWRMGIDRKERTTLVTSGPFGLVRHPIYVFQAVMLAGVALLLPTWLSVIAIGLHLVCIQVKTADEETFLLEVHGGDYQEYQARTGKLFPKVGRGKRAPGPRSTTGAS